MVIPAALTVTAPDVTAKSAVANEAIPLFDVVASSPVIVIVLADTAVSIPSPAAKVSVSPVLTTSAVPDSAATVNELITVANVKLPEPSVCKNCDAEPSDLG